MNKENGKNPKSEPKHTLKIISYENAMEFDRQNEIAAKWTPKRTNELSFMEHLLEVNEIINAERDIRINESKRKADKKIRYGSLEESDDILTEDVPDFIEN